MSQYEYLENCLAKTKDQESLLQKFYMGHGKKKNPCEMTEEVSILFDISDFGVPILC